MFGYREADSPELKEAKRQYDRAVYRVKCLEANIERINYADFDLLVDELEKAKEAVRRWAAAARKLDALENPCGKD